MLACSMTCEKVSGKSSAGLQQLAEAAGCGSGHVGGQVYLDKVFGDKTEDAQAQANK